MIKSSLFMVFLAGMSMLHAQETSPILVDGDIVILGAPQGSHYLNIDFPRKNTIIKRGAIPNFNALIGKKLVVESIEVNKNSMTEAVLRRKDGLNFFRFFPSVTADLDKALTYGELKALKGVREDSIAGK